MANPILQISPEEKTKLKEKVNQLRANLSQTQNDLLKDKFISGSKSADEWLDYLKKLAEFDYYADRYTAVFPNLAGKLTTWTFVAYLLLFVGLFFIELIGFWLWLTLAIIPIILWIARAYNPIVRLRKLDLPNYLRGFVVPLLALLKEESKPTELIDLKVNMKSIQSNKKRINMPATATKGNASFFEYEVLNLQTRLSDGTNLHFAYKVLIRERVRYKRKGNKCKLKVKIIYVLAMALPKKNYQVLENETKASSKGARFFERPNRYLFKLKTGKILYTTTQSYKGNTSVEYEKMTQAAMSNIPDLNFILNLMSSIYKKVKPIETKV